VPAPPPPPPEPTPPAGRSKTPPKAGGKKDEAKETNRILSEGVLFERLLVGKRDSKGFIITNPGVRRGCVSGA
jgi:hypothetical protein